MRSQGSGFHPIYNWYPQKKGKDTRDAKRKGHVRTQEEDNHIQPKERGLTKIQTFQHLGSGLPVSFSVSKALLLKAPSLWYLVTAPLATHMNIILK